MTTIHKATSEDIPALVEMMREFYAESDYPLDGNWAAGSFSALLRDDSLGAVWVASRDSEPAGYVVLTVRFSMEYGGLDAFIDDLFVRTAFRRRGLGRALVKALLDECGRRRVIAAHVEVGHDNDAAKMLYGGFGLKQGDDGRLKLTARLDEAPGVA
ncbi:MAG TPA: GNAT family N-acetyltransferase [Pyrinomonadaceae bacterium]|nr:GNAT family N-acetyltransferase [Pyrinomonadaceae bacterium]